MKATEIIAKYTSGEKTLEETNAALYEIRAGFHLNPERNTIKEDEVGRFGLLDTGTATLDKVEIKDGKLTDHYVSPVVMSGYVPDLLKSISMISDDFVVTGAVYDGYCGPEKAILQDMKIF